MTARITHPAEEDLILHFYGEASQPEAIRDHLGTCAACRSEFDAIARTLTMVATPPTPQRGDLYGLEVWQRIRPNLPPPTSWARIWRARWTTGIVSAGVAALVMAAFVAGRSWPAASRSASAPVAQTTVAAAPVDDRALTVALVDHLERSERVLVDLANADGAQLDVTREQAWAADLVDANRLYREAAVQAGETTTASVLDDLERTLLDIVHAPSTLTPAELEDVRARLDAAALLFKVRVLSNELREREMAPLAPRKTT